MRTIKNNTNEQTNGGSITNLFEGNMNMKNAENNNSSTGSVAMEATDQNRQRVDAMFRAFNEYGMAACEEAYKRNRIDGAPTTVIRAELFTHATKFTGIDNAIRAWETHLEIIAQTAAQKAEVESRTRPTIRSNDGRVKLTVGKKDDEWRVTWMFDGKYNEENTCYCGDDKEDAIGTMNAMIKMYNESVVVAGADRYDPNPVAEASTESGELMMRAALGVITTCPAIRDWLAAHDPMALRQCRAAAIKYDLEVANSVIG